METVKTYPKGTTKEQWDRYEMDLQNHEAWCDSRQRFADDILKSVAEFGVEKAREIYTKAISETRSMGAPNKPGYYRANND